MTHADDLDTVGPFMPYPHVVNWADFGIFVEDATFLSDTKQLYEGLKQMPEKEVRR